MAVILCGCRSKVPSTPLSFYTVSEEKIDGGRFIDTADFPKLGYISVVPDLVITQLAEVSAETGATGPELDIMMRPEDAKKFEALTERVVMKKILLMLGDEPLIAPWVQAPIPTQRLILNLGKNTNNKKVEGDLKKLVR
jgi:hypothetical protein